MENDEHLLKTLSVETLRVYNFFLRHNPPELALEDIAKGLKLTKPTVIHHLDKLKGVGLIKPTSNGYRVEQVVKVAIIRGYTRIFEKLLVSWVPVIVLFLFLSVISTLTINQIQVQIIVLFLCLLGIVIAVREIKQIW